MNNQQLTVIEQALVQGNIAQLTSEQRVSYVSKLCEIMGLNPLTKPFEYMSLQGKLVLYATKGCAEQLRNVNKISLQITDRKVIEGVYIVTARAKTQDGREDESTGVVPIQGLKGDHLANAFMKAETKAKRRVTLSLLGLNMLDEIEANDIPKEKIIKEPAAEPSFVGRSGAEASEGGTSNVPSKQDPKSTWQSKPWKPSEAQMKRMYAIMTAHGHTKESVAEERKKRFGVEPGTNPLTREEYDYLCKWMENAIGPVVTQKEVEKIWPSKIDDFQKGDTWEGDDEALRALD